MISLLQQKEYSQAIPYIKKGLQENPNDYDLNMAMGIAEHNKGNYIQAIHYFQIVCKFYPRNSRGYENLGHSYYKSNQFKLAIQHFHKSLQLHETTEAYHSLALSYHYSRDYTTAQYYYERTLERNDSENPSQLHFDYGVTLQYRGKIEEALAQYNEAVILQQAFPQAWINIAVLHQKYGLLSDSIPHYERALKYSIGNPELEQMILTNLGTAYELIGEVNKGIYCYHQAQEIVIKKRELSNDMKQREFYSIQLHLRRAKMSICFWKNYQANIDELIHLSEYYELTKKIPSALLPFDALTMPVSSKWKKWLTEIYTSQWKDLYHIIDTSIKPHEKDSTRLNIGYLSFDFNDHPTTHLMEGLFFHHSKFNFVIKTFCYGKDDGTIYRQQVQKLSEEFISMTSLGYEDSAAIIQSKGVHILLDAQAHTRGGRPEITAIKPAPIQVNYLVYPGTMGATYIDYLIADSYVVSLENPDSYTEKLVLMPYSYQVNYYPERVISSSSQSKTMRTDFHLPINSFVFVCFNKNDKIDPQVFLIWMNILKQVPQSVLWLLKPSKQPKMSELVQQNLWKEAENVGIPKERIVFAERVNKQRHIKRHELGDLFLDTFTYGAHSTATDALKGGLPVLTLAGEGFPSRVGISLLHNIGSNELITNSKKEFEALAVYLATHQKVLEKLKYRLLTKETYKPLFDTFQYTFKLERGFEAMWDIYRANIKPLNIVLSK